MLFHLSTRVCESTALLHTCMCIRQSAPDSKAFACSHLNKTSRKSQQWEVVRFSLSRKPTTLATSKRSTLSVLSADQGPWHQETCFQGHLIGPNCILRETSKARWLTYQKTNISLTSTATFAAKTALQARVSYHIDYGFRYMFLSALIGSFCAMRFLEYWFRRPGRKTTTLVCIWETTDDLALVWWVFCTLS